MELILSKSSIVSWLSKENKIFTAIMEGETVTNAKILSVVHGIIVGYILLRSLAAGYLAIVLSLIWFTLSLLVCLKTK